MPASDNRPFVEINFPHIASRLNLYWDLQLIQYIKKKTKDSEDATVLWYFQTSLHS